MRKRKDLSDFHKALIVIARRLGDIIFQTVGPVGYASTKSGPRMDKCCTGDRNF